MASERRTECARCNEPCADEPKKDAGSLLTSRVFRAKMHTANAATVSKLACEPVGMDYETRFCTRLRQVPPVIAAGYVCTYRGSYREVRMNRSGNTVIMTRLLLGR